MIGKKAPNPKKSSSKSARVGLLTAYITNPELKNGHEKCVHFEAENFITDDLQSQTQEMIALSHQAVRSKDPIDHYVLSWQEGEQPTVAQAREAVRMTLKHLGLEGHQVIWGMHSDTDNFHIHIEVNRVNPLTFKVVEINKGFQNNAIQQAAAIVEKVQGWKTHGKSRFKTDELGHLITDSKTKLPKIFEEADKQNAPTGPARDKEIQTGQKSAQRIAIEDGAPIIAQAKSWADLHEKMAAAGMEYRREGSGAKIYVGDVAVKASDVDRKASFGNLQKRFGLYQPPNHKEIKNDPNNRPRTELVANRFKSDFTKTGFGTGNNMRDLSSSRLAHSEKTGQGKTNFEGVLQLDVSADRLRTGRMRRGGHSDRAEIEARGKRVVRPLKDHQHGWSEYIAIRDARKAAKTSDTLELQKRHGAERVALLAKLKAERTEQLKGNWQGKGAERNATQSLLAPLQAAEKLELSELHKTERKALQAKYKPLPIYKIWKEQPQIVGLVVLSATEQNETRDKQITLAKTLRSLTNRTDARHHITYQLNKKDVFRDEGRVIQVLDLNSEAGIAAALATAQQKFGNVLTLTGSEAFMTKAVAVAVANGLTCKFADPAMETLRVRLQAEKYQAARQQSVRPPTREKAPLTPAPVIPPIQPTREADAPVSEPEAQQQPGTQEAVYDADPRSHETPGAETPASGRVVTAHEAFLALHDLPVVEVGKVEGMRLDAAEGRLGVFSMPNPTRTGRVQVLCEVPHGKVMPAVGQVFDSRAVPGKEKDVGRG